jgi:hypothetical protein
VNLRCYFYCSAFVCNDHEHERRAVDTIVTPRALGEACLVVTRDARSGALMTSYYKINGGHVSEDPFRQGSHLALSRNYVSFP